jgi:3-oxoacyl-[acyl-carrier protein] reductase
MNSRLSPEELGELADMTPLCRIGTPGEVAAAALFLASDEAAFITGEIMNVSGGFVV